MMSRAEDTKLADILISPCVPVEYSLGPRLTVNGYLVTRSAAEIMIDLRKDAMSIQKRGENAWAICDDMRNVLNKDSGKFEYEVQPSVSRNEKFIEQTRFKTLVEAKDFWYNTYVKNMLATCRDEDSGIHGVWVDIDGQLGIHRWGEDAPVTYESVLRS